MSGFRRTHRLNFFFRTVPLTEKESWHGRSITVFYTERHMFDELSNRNFPAVVNFRRRILTSGMMLYDDFREILKIQKFRRIVGYTTFYCFTAALTYFYTNNTTRAGYSRGDQFYAAYPAGTELLTDSAKLYKAALGNCFETEEWGPIEFCVMAKHFDRQGKAPYAYHAQHMAHLLSLGQLDGSG